MAGNYLLDNEGEQAAQRFDALSDVFDPVTFRHLEVVGVDKGWRCWEVGAGGPSVPSWLASKVGGDCVIASDIDVRWLGTHAGFGVLEHDVVTDAPPPGPFDLVHARLVLTHLPSRDVALSNMVAALRPGGWLVIEDFDVDFQPCATPDASTPQQYLANRIRAGFITLLAERGVDLELGRKLPRLFRQHGLVDVAADAYFPLALPAGAALDCSNVDQVRTGLIGLKVASDEEIDSYLAAAESGAIDIATPPLVSVWGRRGR
jgi:SAM-dependent methyltransferase